MSVRWLSWRRVVIDTLGIGTGPKAIALYLSTFMTDDNDMAWPSLDRICHDMEITKPTAIKHLDALAAAGLLTRRKRFGATTVYHARLPEAIEEAADSLSNVQNYKKNTNSKESLLLGLKFHSSKESLPSEVKFLSGALYSKDLNTNTYAHEQAQCSPNGERIFVFEDMWALYPRKVGKLPARKVWERLHKKDRKAVMEDLASRQWPDDPQYILHPRTYLHQRRWEDEASTRVAAVFGEDM